MNKRTQYFRHISLLSLLLIGLLAYSQDVKSTTSEGDTLYIYFKHGKHEIINGPNLFSPPNTMVINYFFKSVTKNDYIRFQYVSRVRNKQRELVDNSILIKPKKFLRKNKENVYSYCKFKKMGSLKTSSFYWKNLHKTIIYLIDKRENKNDKIFLRKVTMGSSLLPII